MTSTRGFGKPQPQPKQSQRSIERAAAVKRYDEMKTDGIPDFEVYIRIEGQKNWYPVGSLALRRSSQIHAAIFDSQEQLLQGAFRLFPVLKKNQDHLEYGYRLKEFKDDPIEVAVRPQSKGINGLSTSFNQLKDRVSSLFKQN